MIIILDPGIKGLVMGRPLLKYSVLSILRKLNDVLMPTFKTARALNSLKIIYNFILD